MRHIGHPCTTLAAYGAVTSAVLCLAWSGGARAHSIGSEVSGPAVVGVVAGCDVFPGKNYWNTPVTDLAVHPRSDTWLAHMSPDSTLHPDFGKSYGEQPVPYGIPITVVDGDHAKVEVIFRYEDESDPGPYPLGDDTVIEGGRDSAGDKHAVVVDSSTCELFETWHTRVEDGNWHAGSGATWDLDSNRLRRDGWTSSDAAGLPILPGLLRYDEVEETGLVTHAIRFTTDETQSAHIWPARHDAGSTSSPPAVVTRTARPTTATPAPLRPTTLRCG